MRGFRGAIRPTLNSLIGYAPAPQLSVGYMDSPKLGDDSKQEVGSNTIECWNADAKLSLPLVSRSPREGKRSGDPK